ncbi:sensor histidine kinase [Leptolyngbya sp. Cla-17]|uniref:sensor histidine kinase n=1 Tax=Leptolyngbya sp. Cla-17 TaxID=2803751 RepID=UPI0018D611BB|nr:ATP-binding protein [Leptolyngbya sp. Cla-17]
MKQRFRLRQQSLSKQLLLGFGLSLTTVGLTTLWVNYRLIQTDLAQQVHQQAQTITQSLEFATEGLLAIENRSILRRVVQNYATLPAVVEVAIVSPDGLIWAHSTQGTLQFSRRDSSPYKTKHPELTTAIEQASLIGTEISQETVVNSKPALVHILPFSSVLFGTSGRRGLAVAIVDLKQMQFEAEKSFFTSTLVLLIGVVCILLFMGILIHRTVLRPLNALNDAVTSSKQTGVFTMPQIVLASEIRFLATTFDTVLKKLQTHNQLKSEITQRKQVEAELRESEASEKQKSRELEQTLQELRHTQMQLVQSEKMSSLGQLVAGVAHEINNPVNFIHGNLHHASQYTQDLLDLLRLYQEYNPAPTVAIQTVTEEIDLEFLREDLPKLLVSMQVGADRIREIVKSLRSFSRLDEAEVKDVDIHEGIDSTLMILHNRLKSKSDYPAIQVVKDYGDLPRIECYAGQLNQVFMNILSNAIDALDEQNQQRSPAEVMDRPSIISLQTRVVGTDSVEIQVADNGPGIPEAVQKRLFDPFFTTKAVGKGTGMGMSISHQIITERHKGKLECHSSPPQGAAFVIRIPIRQTY